MTDPPLPERDRPPLPPDEGQGKGRSLNRLDASRPEGGHLHPLPEEEGQGEGESRAPNQRRAPSGPPDLILHGPHGFGATVGGEALVSSQGFSARYDLDRERGVFSRPAHDLHGQSLVGRVLVFPTAKGGVASSWMLREMASRQVAPLALIFTRTNPVMVQGAVLAGIPILHRLTPDPAVTIRSGDWVEVDPAAGEVRLWR